MFCRTNVQLRDPGLRNLSSFDKTDLLFYVDNRTGSDGAFIEKELRCDKLIKTYCIDTL